MIVVASAMELIEGMTLTERIRQAPVPLSGALRIAIQMADALEARTTSGRSRDRIGSGAMRTVGTAFRRGTSDGFRPSEVRSAARGFIPGAR
jgi:hypothetical protein